MNWFNRLPHSVRATPGLEWTILKKLPFALLAGTLVPLAISLGYRLFTPQHPAVDSDKAVGMVDILCIATAVTVWSAVLTVAIGCFVVRVMKGPAYVADAYELSDADRPGPRS